jgi:hypothetical protein
MYLCTYPNTHECFLFYNILGCLYFSANKHYIHSCQSKFLASAPNKRLRICRSKFRYYAGEKEKIVDQNFDLLHLVFVDQNFDLLQSKNKNCRSKFRIHLFSRRPARRASVAHKKSFRRNASILSFC